MNIKWGTIILETLGMTLISTVLAYLVGVPLGIVLTLTSKNGLRPNRVVNGILGVIVSFLRSVPCVIMLVILLPLTRAIVGIGTGAWYTMIIPLFFSSFAYVARVVEQSLRDVDPGVIEAARSMGASDKTIVRRVYIPEARSSLILGFAITLVNVIGYTSFAWNASAGGLIAEVYTYYTRNTGDFMTSWVFWVLILLVVILVEIIQESGLLIAKKLDKRRMSQ